MGFAEAPVLENAHVRLEQLTRAHEPDLAAAAGAGDLWEKAWYTSVPRPDAVAAEIDRRLGLQAEGRMAPWAIFDLASGRAVGMTTYMNIDEANRRVEIGSTWMGYAAQGTRVNPAAKLLLLARAFDDLNCIAVEFRTHAANAQSRAAIAKLGATQDGILRKHQIWGDGFRDTVVFSILDTEWPEARAGLEARLEG
ncbi:GNAT family N-acetyltransferase [Demequina sp.]|uniref:GNAT family N-acetyltransferase n=1 Tax=Demequina sp. TaxID=2050685 RepID=UPI003D116C08